jgi:outer membrane immunogenic protein
MTFKRFLGAGALAWMLAAGPALAADIPAAPIAKAPMRAAAYDWYGFYIGVSGGYGWSRDPLDFQPDAGFALRQTLGVLPFSQGGNAKGFIGGIQWGSNWQFDRIVLGTESDFSYTDIKSSQTSTATAFAVAFQTDTSQRLKWFSTSRLRGGVLIADNVLLYGTGGLANGRVESSASNTVPGLCAVANCPAGSISKDMWGWAAGGGVEYGAGRWMLKVEYLHYDLGRLNYAMTDPVTAPGAFINVSSRVSGDIVRGGIAYRFNWTPLGLILGRDHI